MTSIPGGLAKAATSGPIVLEGLQNGTEYRFTVHAANASGDSPESSPSNPVTPSNGSSAVIGLSSQGRVIFIAVLIGVFAALWFSLVLYDRVSTYRRHNDLLTTLVDEAKRGPTDPQLTTEEIKALAEVIRQPPKFATGLTRTTIALGLLTLVGVALVALLVGNSNGASDLLKGVVTALTTALTTVLGFYFGSKAAGDAAVLAGGAGAAPTQAPKSAIAPDAPTGVSALPRDGAAEVSFTPPANQGDSPITTYTATSYPGNVATTDVTTPIVVGGLKNGTPYTFTVYATNAAGNSLASDPSVPVEPSA